MHDMHVGLFIHSNNKEMNWRAFVQIKGIAEIWVLDCIEGDNIQQYINNVYRYMDQIGVLDFDIISINRVLLHGVMYDDIILN